MDLGRPTKHYRVLNCDTSQTRTVLHLQDSISEQIAIGFIQTSQEVSRQFNFGETQQIQRVLVIREFNMVAVATSAQAPSSLSADSRVSLYHFKTGLELHTTAIEGKYSVPQILAYDGKNDILLVGINVVSSQRGRIEIYQLFDEQKGLIGLKLLKQIEFGDLLMDIKIASFFDGLTYAAIALKSQILITEVNPSEPDILTKKQKINNQIAITSIKIKHLEFVDSQNNKVEEIQILVADIMKSLSIYAIVNQSRTSKCFLKHRFPFGQWCTAADVVYEATCEFYPTTFFDYNFCLLQSSITA